MTQGSTRVQFEVDGQQVEVTDDGGTLLGALRDVLGNRSVKDGCSPQGQCGCCTVLVDGQPRVACVTPTRRIGGRAITTIEGLDETERNRWSAAFCATGASQCGFCTPGIIMRLSGLEAKKPNATDDDVHKALAAHLCRCTGWQTIMEAWHQRDAEHPDRDWNAASQRAQIEGRTPQQVAPDVALGEGGFADDTAPAESPVAVRSATGDWVLGGTLHEARQATGKVQGRRTTLAMRPCAPRGSIPATSKPMRPGLHPTKLPPLPSPTAARSAPSSIRRSPVSPNNSRPTTNSRCAFSLAAKTRCASAPSDHRSPAAHRLTVRESFEWQPRRASKKRSLASPLACG